MSEKPTKYEHISNAFPSLTAVDWASSMGRDEDLFVRLLGDVIKSGGRGSKPGKRPVLDRKDAQERFNQIAGDDYSEMEFKDAFDTLCGNRSLRHLARLTGFSKTYVRALRLGDATPTFEQMEQIATSFKKHPSYFLEYRIGFVASAVSVWLETAPETATAWYVKLGRGCNGL